MSEQASARLRHDSAQTLNPSPRSHHGSASGGAARVADRSILQLAALHTQASVCSLTLINHAKWTALDLLIRQIPWMVRHGEPDAHVL